jgi:outer membrane protein TolC
MDAAAARVRLAEKASSPDFAVGLSYALVGRRNDTAGQINPPEGNGDDILSLSGGVTLPVWRSKNAAGIEEAAQQRLAAEASKRQLAAEIEAELSDLVRRIPIIQEQLELFSGVLATQAEESLRSAEGAYAAGTASALDLLDAERTLFGVRLAIERTQTDLAVALVELEGALAAPLERVTAPGGSS